MARRRRTSTRVTRTTSRRGGSAQLRKLRSKLTKALRKQKTLTRQLKKAKVKRKVSKRRRK